MKTTNSLPKVEIVEADSVNVHRSDIYMDWTNPITGGYEWAQGEFETRTDEQGYTVIHEVTNEDGVALFIVEGRVNFKK